MAPDVSDGAFAHGQFPLFARFDIQDVEVSPVIEDDVRPFGMPGGPVQVFAATSFEFGDLRRGEFLLPRDVGRGNPDISHLRAEHHLPTVRRKAGTYPVGERPQFLLSLGRENSSFALTTF